MTVDDIIQQQTQKFQQQHPENTDSRVDTSPESSQDPVFSILHSQGKVSIGKIKIESF